MQFGAEDRAVGSPKHHTGSDGIIDVKEFKFAAEFAVIAGAGLLEAFKVFRELFLRGEGGAVNALELFVLVVAAMVGSCDGE